jgi:trimethylamine:corrinoid methyltransferase-like protein
MAQGAPLLAGGHVALEDVQVGAADGGGVDLDDRVAGMLQLGVRLGLPLLAVGSVVDERLHDHLRR